MGLYPKGRHRLRSGQCARRPSGYNLLHSAYLKTHGLPTLAAASATFEGSELILTDAANIPSETPVDDTLARGLRGKSLVFIRDAVKAAKIRFFVPVTFGKDESPESSLQKVYAMIPPVLVRFEEGELSVVTVAQDGRILETSTRTIELIGFRHADGG
jgi:hypothetical protein